MSVTEATTTIESIIVDTGTRPNVQTSSLSQILVQFGLVVFSCIAVVWGGFTIGSSWSEAKLSGVTARIMEGETFKADVLRELEPQLMSSSIAKLLKPELVRSVAVIRLRQAELEIEAGSDVTNNARFDQAESSLKRALKIMPTDSFLWFGLSWLTKARNGFDASVASYLRLSYKTGEHEGWVASHRNALAVSILTSLPDVLQVCAVTEFKNLVTSEYISVAAEILTGPGWSQHDRLLSTLDNAAEQSRLRFARAVVNLGFDVVVPGTDRQASRPWK